MFNRGFDMFHFVDFNPALKQPPYFFKKRLWLQQSQACPKLPLIFLKKDSGANNRKPALNYPLFLKRLWLQQSQACLKLPLIFKKTLAPTNRKPALNYNLPPPSFTDKAQ